MIGDHAGKLGALPEHGVDHLTDVIAGGQSDDLGQSLAEHAVAVLGGARDRCVEGGAAQQQLLALVKHREMRRDLRLQRKPLQQSLAEAVDGVDLQSAFGFERPREQAPRVAHIVFGRAVHQCRERVVQFGILDRRPFAKHLEQAVLHLGGSGLGVGQAEN